MKKAILVITSFLIYSSSGIFTKIASQQELFSLACFTCFAGAIVIMVIFAVLWQKILKIMPLNKAFLCKSMCVIITMIYAYLIFDETVTISNCIGAMLIIGGLTVLSNNKTQMK